MEENENFEEYVWRFKLDPAIRRRPLYDDKRTEMIRIQLKELLGILYLTYNGKKVKVNGFKYYFEGDDTEYKIFEDEAAMEQTRS